MMRRILPWALGVPAGLLAAVLLVLPTPPGRALLRVIAENAASAALQGQLSVGDIQGSPYGRLQLIDVTLTSTSGQTAVSAGAVTLEYRLFALLSSTVHVREFSADELKVDWPVLASVLPRSSKATAEDDAGASMTIIVDRAHIDAPEIVVSPGQKILGLTVAATATVSQGGIAARVSRLTAEWDGLAVNGAARVHWAADALVDLDARAQLGDIRLDVRRTESSTHAIDLAGRIRWPPGAVAAVVKAPVARSAADLKFHAFGALDRLRAEIDGALGRGTVDVEFEGPNDPLLLRFNGRRLDLSSLHDAAPPSKLDLLLTGRFNISDLVPTGRVRLGLQGTIRAIPSAPMLSIKRSRIVATAGPQVVDVRLDLDSSAGRLRGTAALEPWRPNPQVRTAQVWLDGLELAEVTPALRGTVTATLAARGAVTAPRLDAQLDVTALRISDIRLKRVAADVSTRIKAGGTDIEWRRMSVETPAAVWTATAGIARLRPTRATIAGLAFRSDRAVLGAEADIALKDPLGRHSTATVDLVDFDLSKLAGLHPAIVARPRGVLAGQLRFNGAKREIDAQFALRRARWSPSWPAVSAWLGAHINAQQAVIQTSARGREWGRIAAHADVLAPEDWARPNAWFERGLVPVRAVDADWDIDLAALLPTRLTAGATEGRLRMGPGARRMTAHFVATDVRATDLPRLSRVDADLSSTDSGIKADLTASIEGRRALTARGSIDSQVPELLRRPLTMHTARFDARIDAFPLELLAVPSPVAKNERIAGRVSLRATGELGRKGPTLKAQLDARQIQLSGQTPPIQVTVAADTNGDRMSATVSASAPELGEHHGELQGDLPADTDVASLLNGLQSVRFDGQGLKLSAVGALSGAGDLDGEVAFGMSAGPGLRAMTATLTASNVRLHRALAPADLRTQLVQTATGTAWAAHLSLGSAPLLTARAATPLTIRQTLLDGAVDTSASLSAEVRSAGYPIGEALADARHRDAFEGRLRMNADINGPLRQPTVAASMNMHALRLGDTRFSQAEIKHRSDPRTRMTRIRFSQPSGGQLAVDVDARQALDIDLSARAFRLGFLATLADLTNAGAAVDGVLDGGLTIRGDPANARLDGQLSARDVRLALDGAPPIERGQLTVAMQQQRASIKLDAQSGGGLIDAQLAVDAGPSPGLEGRFGLSRVQWATAGQVVSIDLKGNITGGVRDDGYAADVVLSDGFIRLPDQSSRNLHPITQRSDVVYRRTRWRLPKPDSAAPPNVAPLSIRVRSSKPIGVRGEPIDAVLNIDVVAQPQRRGVAVRGDTRIEQGTVTLFGRRYTVDRGQVLLSGQVPARPRIDVLLSYEFSACTFFIGLSGPADDPKLKLSAEPDIYDDRQLFGFLFGASPDEDNPDKTPEEQGIDAAAGLLLGQIQSQLKRKLPIDTLAVDLGDGTESDQTNVSLGKWLTDRLFVAYTYRHGAAQDENTSEGLLRYRFLSSWLVELVFGDRGNGAADVLWRKRW